MKNLTLINIKEKNIKGKKECDLLFKCECTKQIYYAEVKCNINLDTEKSKSTIDKIMIIVTELQKSYPDYKINSYLIAARYIHSKDISHTLLNKYSEIKENVCGINDFIEIIGCSDMKFGSESEYKCFINKVAYKLLN